MRYAHYWIQIGKPKAIPKEAVVFLCQILEEGYKEGIIQRGSDDNRPPLVTKREVRFTGVGKARSETFSYSLVEKTAGQEESQRVFYCKAAQRPYDELVMRVLLVLAAYLPGLMVHLDDESNIEWAIGRPKTPG